MRFGWLPRVLLLFILFSYPLLGEEELWRYPLVFQHDEVQVQLLNWEFAQGKRMLIIHCILRSQRKSAAYFRWQSLFVLETPDERRFTSNFDALVDRNGSGLTRTVGDFSLARGEKVRISIPFYLGDSDLPARLLLPDGRRSTLIQ